MGKKRHHPKEEAMRADNVPQNAREGSQQDLNSNENPPRTTTNDWLTTPKFGSSTSGGGEIEPGPERD